MNKEEQLHGPEEQVSHAKENNRHNGVNRKCHPRSEQPVECILAAPDARCAVEHLSHLFTQLPNPFVLLLQEVFVAVLIPLDVVIDNVPLFVSQLLSVCF